MSERMYTPAIRSPRALVALVLAAGILGGCSSTPDWANPVEWYKGTRDWVAGDDAQGREMRARDAAKVERPGAAPNLATVPERPRDLGTAQLDPKSVREGLVADRAQARHAALGPGDNALNRADPGVMPPPPASLPAPARAGADSVPAPPAAPPAPYSPPDRGAGPDQPAAAPPPVLEPPPPSVAAQSDGTGVRAAYEAALAQSAPTVTTLPAGLRDSGPVPMTTTRNTLPVPPLPRGSMVLEAPPEAIPSTRIGDGESVPGSSVQVARILFGNGSSDLSRESIQALEQVVKLRQERGGLIRIVGHASSRTKDVDAMRHRLVNFRLSLARANSVARQLVKMGVPADAVQVQARSDNEPIYHEFMPAGEAGNRRAEIYLDY